jgi:short-subunit dehydrogenase
MNNKTVLITGGNSGIGLELAKIFAKEKYDLILVAKNVEKLNSAATEMQSLGAKVRTIIKDLSGVNAAEEIYHDVKAKEGKLDVLVNNAGFGNYGLFTDIANKDDFDVIEVNMGALTKLCKFFAKDMKAEGEGKILNVGSSAGFQPGPTVAVYYASKAYVNSFTRALHHELKPYGITVTVLCPGATETNFAKQAHMEKSYLFNNPRVMSAAEVAQAGFDGLMAGREIVIPGFLNKVNALIAKIIPASWAARLARLAQQDAR